MTAALGPMAMAFGSMAATIFSQFCLQFATFQLATVHLAAVQVTPLQCCLLLQRANFT